MKNKLAFVTLFFTLVASCLGLGLGPFAPAQHAINGFNPTQVPFVVCWYDTERTCLPAGTSVNAVRDFTFRNANMVNITASLQPKISNINGRKSLLFDGTNDYMSIASLNLHSRIAMFAVVQTETNVTGKEAFFEHGPNALSNPGFAFSGGYTAWLVNRGGGTHSADINWGWIGNSPTVVSFSYMTGTGVVGKEWLDVGFNAVNGTTRTNTSLTDSLYVYSRAGSTDFSKGHLAELIIITNGLSEANQLLIQRYLATKYGVSCRHPYPVPDAPFIQSIVGCGPVTIEWDVNNNVGTWYTEIYRANQIGYPFYKIASVQVDAQSVASYVDNTGDLEKVYKVRNVGMGDPSQFGEDFLVYYPPPQITNWEQNNAIFTVSFDHDSQINSCWGDGYEIQYQIDGGGWFDFSGNPYARTDGFAEQNLDAVASQFGGETIDVRMRAFKGSRAGDWVYSSLTSNPF